jgi:hypothetical protein
MRMSFTSRRDGRGRGARRSADALDSMPVEQTEDLLEDPAKPASARGWYASSLELRHGLEVSDVPLDTLPDDLIDGFTKW